MIENDEMTDAEAEAAIQENITLGFIEMIGPDTFRLTDAGRKSVEDQIKKNPRMFIEMGLDKGLH